MRAPRLRGGGREGGDRRRKRCRKWLEEDAMGDWDGYERAREEVEWYGVKDGGSKVLKYISWFLA
jgi:hypothetical protein